MAIQKTFAYTIPAAGVIPNLLAGTAFEFLTRASIVSMYATADAAGDTLTLNINQGGDSQSPIPEPSAIHVAEGAGQGPVVPDDVVINQMGINAGSRLVLAVQGVAAHTGRVMFFVTP